MKKERAKKLRGAAEEKGTCSSDQHSQSRAQQRARPAMTEVGKGEKGNKKKEAKWMKSRADDGRRDDYYYVRTRQEDITRSSPCGSGQIPPSATAQDGIARPRLARAGKACLRCGQFAGDGAPDMRRRGSCRVCFGRFGALWGGCWGPAEHRIGQGGHRATRGQDVCATWIMDHLTGQDRGQVRTTRGFPNADDPISEWNQFRLETALAEKKKNFLAPPRLTGPRVNVSSLPNRHDHDSLRKLRLQAAREKVAKMQHAYDLS